MKKINFRDLSIEAILTRKELSQIGGGNSSLAQPKCDCNNDGDCPPSRQSKPTNKMHG